MAKTKIILDDKVLQEIIRKVVDPDVDSWIIADGVNYGIFVEFGTSKMSARPALIPAFERVAKNLLKAIGQVIEQAGSLNDLFSKAAFDIQSEWASNVPAPTGTLKNSIHTEQQ